MGILDGQSVSAAITNPAFINKNQNDTMPNVLGFTRALSGATISDIQAAVNKLYTATGASETVTGTVYNATAGTISNGDSYQTALTTLADKFDAATGHSHSGAAGDGPPIAGSAITGVPLSQFVVAGSLINAATGSSFNATTLMTGETPSSGSTVEGVIVTAPYNRVYLASGNTPSYTDELVDSSGNIIYGRLTESSGTWTINFYTLQSNVETAYTFTTATNILWYYRKLYSTVNTNPVYEPEFERTSRGVTSLAASGNAALYGNVLIAGLSGTSITQTGNTIFISASGGGGGATGISSPLTTKGDLWTYSTTDTRLAVGATGTYLTPDPAEPTGLKWATIATSTSTVKNYLMNSTFEINQHQTSAGTVLVTNGNSTYTMDRWFVKNGLGTNGVITGSIATDGSTTDPTTSVGVFSITTAPTASQANVFEVWQVIDRELAQELVNQNISLSIRVLGLNNVNQVGVQFYYATTVTKPTVAIGTEQTFTVNTSTFTTCTINGQAVGSSFAPNGVLGVRIRITGVSTGNIYNINNGFYLKQGIVTASSTAASSWVRMNNTLEAEIAACQRYVEKSYDIATGLGTATQAGCAGFRCYFADGNTTIPISYKSRKRAAATTLSVYSTATGTVDRIRDNNATTDLTATTATSGEYGFRGVAFTGTTGNDLTFQWYASSEI